VTVRLALSAALVLAACGSPPTIAARKFGPAPALELEARAPRVEADTTAERTITVSALGDCALGDLRHGAGAPGSFAARLSQEDQPLDYPFSGVADLLAQDDLTIANLEGTLTEHSGWQNEVFSIRGKPQWAAMLTRGSVELVDIANNHSDDYGTVGHEDTKRALSQSGVNYFGRGTVDRRQIRGMKVVNLGYLGGPPGTEARMTAAVRREATQAAIVIVSFHWGVEGYYATHPDQKRLGHAAIDAGASLVLGHHPHVLQGIETYRDRHIVYSLGNFVFGANSQPADTDSIIYQEQFVLEDDTIKAVKQRIIPVRISTSTRQNDFRPTLLQDAERERVLAKLDGLSGSLP
jgi:poly-gamma-glutamate capsule biosynthesis protein CapA/YwtB (metallophosphatase superfamily)